MFRINKFFQQRKKESLLNSEFVHDIRTPISSLRNGIEGISENLEMLVNVYQMALQNGITDQRISSNELSALKKTLHAMKTEAYYVNYYINAFSLLCGDLSVYKEGKFELDDFSVKKMLKCCFHEYPAKNDAQRRLLANDFSFDDFIISFNNRLLSTVIFGILKYGMRMIEKSAGAGDIEVSASNQKRTLQIKINFDCKISDAVNEFKKTPWFEFSRNVFYRGGKFELSSIKSGICFYLKFTKNLEGEFHAPG